MAWKDVAATVGQYAPMLGAILGGPIGAAVTVAGSIAATALGVPNDADAVAKALSLDPAAAVKLAQIEADKRVQLEGLASDVAKAELAAIVANASDINATMRAEAAAEHWPSYSWRPFIGFCVGFNTAAASVIVLAVFVPMMFGNANAAGAVASLPLVIGALAGISGVVMPILGIASWYRGKMQADPSVPTINKG